MKRYPAHPKAGSALLAAGALLFALLSGCTSDVPEDGEPQSGRGTTSAAETIVPTATDPADPTDRTVSVTTHTATRPTTTRRPTAARTSARTTSGKSVIYVPTMEKTQATTTTRSRPRPTLAGPSGSESFTNLTYDNAGGKMGDNDGPAYCAYSKIGYNSASLDILLSELQMNVFRESDLLPLTAYIFLGMDVYDDNGAWINCFDAGLGYNTGKQKWVLFFNIYDAPPTQNKWYMSGKYLDDTHDYRITLDTDKDPGWATLAVYDLTDGGREYDSVTFQTRGTKTDGSNTAFYQDYALDFPDNVKYNTSGKPVKNNWQEITLYNTDENVYMKNLKIVGAKLNGEPWTAEKTQNRAVWPDCSMSKINYPVVRVSHASFDTELQIDFDMNR